MAPAGNEGVGEHVRTRFHFEPSNPIGVLEPVKLRTSGIRTERRKNLFLLPDRLSRKANSFEITIQPFDLMSRRHPLSSTRANLSKSAFRKQTVRKARVTCRHQAAGNFLQARFTSSSWRPCGSSSQSSSLRSSPSLPS
jgi:hypothetical protein